MWDVIKIVALAICGVIALLAGVIAVYAVREFRHATRDDER
jgi:hypothetical protein